MMNNKNSAKIDILLNNLERDLLTKEQVEKSGKRVFAKIDNKLLNPSTMESISVKTPGSSNFANWFAKYKYISLTTLSVAVLFGGYLVYQGLTKPEKNDDYDVITKMASRYEEVTNGISIQDLQQYEMLTKAAAVAESGQSTSTPNALNLGDNATSNNGAASLTASKDYRKAIDDLIKNSNIKKNSATVLRAEVDLNENFSDSELAASQQMGLPENVDKFTLLSVNSYDTYIDLTESADGFTKLYLSDPSQSVEYRGGDYSIKTLYQATSEIDCTNTEVTTVSPEDPDTSAPSDGNSCVEVKDYINGYELKSFEATILESLLFDTNVKELGLIENGKYYAFEQYMDVVDEDGNTIYNTYIYYFNPETFALNRMVMLINDELFATINVIESTIVDGDGISAIKSEVLAKIANVPQKVDDSYINQSDNFSDFENGDYKSYADRFDFYTFNSDEAIITNIYDYSLYEDYLSESNALRETTAFDPNYVPYEIDESYISESLSYMVGNTTVSIWNDKSVDAVTAQQKQWRDESAEVEEHAITVNLDGTSVDGVISKITNEYEYYDENNVAFKYSDTSYFLMFNHEGTTYVFSEFDFDSGDDLENIEEAQGSNYELFIKPSFDKSTIELFLAK